MKKENIIKKKEILEKINLLNLDGVTFSLNTIKGPINQVLCIYKDFSKSQLEDLEDDSFFDNYDLRFWTLDHEGNKHFINYEFKQIKEKTKEEKILNLLAEAYNLFLDLDSQHPNEKEDFVKGIHQCQYVLGMRIAREYKPDLFPLKKE